MFKFCSAILISTVSCIGIQHVGSSHRPGKTLAVQHTNTAHDTVVYDTNTEKIVWMQINNGEYTEIKLQESADIILESLKNEQ